MASSAQPTRDDFAAMLESSLGKNQSFEGRVVKGRVTAIENDLAVIDVGLKSEGRVALREFAAPGMKAELKVGDEVEVYVDRVENAQGEAMLSRDRARREGAWDALETQYAANERVEGVIFGRVKGGFTVDLDGATAFERAYGFAHRGFRIPNRTATRFATASATKRCQPCVRLSSGGGRSTRPSRAASWRRRARTWPWSITSSRLTRNPRA